MRSDLAHGRDAGGAGREACAQPHGFAGRVREEPDVGRSLLLEAVAEVPVAAAAAAAAARRKARRRQHAAAQSFLCSQNVRLRPLRGSGGGGGGAKPSSGLELFETQG